MSKSVQNFFASSWAQPGSQFSALISFAPDKPDLDGSENSWVSIILKVRYFNSIVKQKITTVNCLDF